jgi:membrane dipeptidase
VISRRSALAAGVYALGAPFINRGSFRLFGNDATLYSTATLDLIRSTTVVDMLGLLTLDYRKLTVWQSKPDALTADDVLLLKASGTTIFHPAVGFTSGNIYASSLRDLSNWNRFLDAHPTDFMRVQCPGDIAQAKASGKLGIILGLQNSEHFRTIDDVDYFYKLGQRVSQLTYNDNRLGGGSMDPGTGLRDFGAQVVERMNTLGMAVDVSHCSDRTTLDTVELSSKPVLVTHSNCRALSNSTRCKTDEAIGKLAAKGGVFGVTMVRPFVRASGAATLEHVLDHIDHVAKIAGVDHVGVGTDVDFAGRERVAKTSDLDGLAYPKKIFDLTEGLFHRKYTRDQVALIMGGNFQRTLSAIWNS